MNTARCFAAALVATLAAGCPSGPASPPDGASATDAATDAPVLDASLCAVNPSASPPGGPCRCDSDCAQGALCGDEAQSGAPGGRCLLPCPSGDPPAGYGCLRLAFDQTILVSLCGDDLPDCRDGFACQQIAAPDPALGCAALCTSDAQCTMTGHCDLYTGLCLPPAPGATLGAACNAPSACRSGECESPPVFPAGECVSPCDLRTGGCPENGVCFGPSGSPQGSQFGFCFPTCMTTADCRTGYHCVDVALGMLGCVPIP